MKQDFDQAIVEVRDHRPYPMPSRPWVMQQSWHDLLFAHWPVPVAGLRPRVPDGLPLDTFDGTAWIGIVPFRMTNVTARGLPPPPVLSAFPELNVRTYVVIDDKPGVFFFSLDAARLAAVVSARLFRGLTYQAAEMRVDTDGDRVRYRSRRRWGTRALVTEFAAEYAPNGPPSPPRAGTLEHWLTERYCLYTVAGGRISRLDIHHSPWPLQPAEADVRVNTMAAGVVELPDVRPLTHFARRVDMVGWWPVRLKR
jgi:uncharacterized protein YqjF (DUF2071 family)